MNGSTHRSDDPVRSPSRLQEIWELDLTSKENDAALQDLVRKASEHLGLPVSLVSVVLDEAQYFAAKHGLAGWIDEVRGTPVEWSFCTNVVRSGTPFVVEDAALHPATRDIPIVEEENVRSYAGVPLRTSKGEVVGSFCVIGEEPHVFQPEDVDYLLGLAAQAMERIETRRRSAPGSSSA